MFIKLMLILAGICLLGFAIATTIRRVAMVARHKRYPENAKALPMWMSLKAIYAMTVSAILLIVVSFGIYYIPPQTSGLVTLKVGAPLETGQLIALKGQRGQQGDILTPGFGWNWKYPFLMSIDVMADVTIPAGQFAVLTAKDGKMNPEIVAPFWTDDIDPKRMIEDYNYFVEKQGVRGVQQYLLTTGNYRINQFQWDYKIHNMINIQSNEVMVIESKFGKAPAFKDTSDDEILTVPLVESEEFRGIVDSAYPSGFYAIHPVTQVAHHVPITLQTFIYGGGYTSKIMDLAIDPENDKLITKESSEKKATQKHGDAFAAKTKDNHTVYIDVRVLGQIEPAQAPRFIGTIKETDDLDNRIIEPYTRNILTNMVLSYEALELKDKKEELGEKLSAALRVRTKNTGFRTKTVEITNIDIPPIVLIPGKISSASIALKEALIQKESSVDQAILVRNKQSQADNQAALAQATVDNLAADQTALQIKTLADAALYKAQKEAEAAAFKIQQEAEAQSYRMDQHAQGVSKLVKVLGQKAAGEILLQETINQAAGDYNVPEMVVYGGGEGTSTIVGAKLIADSLKQ